jgi:anaerobic magnesium-protoporphyrin IX monomethyl ester cyclase
MTEEWIVELAHALAERKVRIPFTIQSRTNLIDPRTAEALAAAGATEVWLGVESGSQRILDAMDKGTKVDCARLATRLLKEQGIRVGWFLQLGYPGEEWEDILRTRDLVHAGEPDDIGVSVSYPLPGTVFHERVVAELGARRNWRDTDDLAMLFRGTFATSFYRRVRDALHADVARGEPDHAAWRALEREAISQRSIAPTGRVASA